MFAGQQALQGPWCCIRWWGLRQELYFYYFTPRLSPMGHTPFRIQCLGKTGRSHCMFILRNSSAITSSFPPWLLRRLVLNFRQLCLSLESIYLHHFSHPDFFPCYFLIPSLHEFLLYPTDFELKQPIKVNTEKKKSPIKISLGNTFLYNKLPTVESGFIFLQNLYKNQKYQGFTPLLISLPKKQ